MNLSAFKKSGHFPTLITAFPYFDYSFIKPENILATSHYDRQRFKLIVKTGFFILLAITIGLLVKIFSH